MVAPVFGPFTELKTHGRALTTERIWYRQGKPYDTPLPWSSRRWILGRESQPNLANSASDGLGPQTDIYIRAKNKAYANLVSQLGEASMWGVNLAEQEQSLNMIVNRARQVGTFIQLLRKAKFIEAAKHLKMSFFPKGVRKSRSFGNNFLEYHFGWEPLLNDVHAAVETFLDPHLPGYRPISSRGSAGGEYFYPPSPGSGISGWRGRESAKVRMGAALSITNPNLHLAQQLGLVNPASVAWELVPFSFVVDWWSNVGQVLSSYTDFVGCDLKDAYTTSYAVCQSSRLYYWGDTADFTVIETSRGLGIAAPTIEVRPFKGLSPVRGITAISLLLQKLR